MKSISSDDFCNVRPPQFEDVTFLRRAIEELKDQVTKDGKDRGETEELRKENWTLKERVTELEK